jgi:hypothetical protein
MTSVKKAIRGMAVVVFVVIAMTRVWADTTGDTTAVSEMSFGISPDTAIGVLKVQHSKYTDSQIQDTIYDTMFVLSSRIRQPQYSPYQPGVGYDLRIESGAEDALFLFGGDAAYLGSINGPLWLSGKDIFINPGITNGVGIGTQDIGGYKLAVDGSIGARELVITDAAWADYVFSDSYELRPLSAVADSIEQNKRLPQMPSEQQVKEEGLSVGEMQAKMMQKIEELTLYMIEMKQENEKITRRNEELMERIRRMEKDEE